MVIKTSYKPDKGSLDIVTHQRLIKVVLSVMKYVDALGVGFEVSNTDRMIKCAPQWLERILKGCNGKLAGRNAFEARVK